MAVAVISCSSLQGRHNTQHTTHKEQVHGSWEGKQYVRSPDLAEQQLRPQTMNLEVPTVHSGRFL